MRRISVNLAALLLVAACGGESSVPADANSPVLSTTGAPVTTAADVSEGSSITTTMTSTSTTSTTVPPEFPLFLAAVEAALEGTRYADDVLAEADVFVAMGQLMCERLDADATADEVLSSFVGALDTDETTEEEAVAIGVVFGAAIELLCPQHVELLG